MIEINCTNCKTLLTIDEGFAGGVCRCQHCGTIQTVPKHLKDGNGESVENGKAQKALWQKKGAVSSSAGSSTSIATTGTGLDDIASAVASSGLSSSRLQKKVGPPATDAVIAVPKKKLLWMVVGAGGVILALLGVIIIMLVGKKADNPPQNPVTPANTAANVSKPANVPAVPKPVDDTPKPPEKEKLVLKDLPDVKLPGTTQKVEPFKKEVTFLGQKITENNIVIVIDRSPEAGKNNRLDLVKKAVIKFLEGMGAGRKFQVIFSSADGKVADSYPDDGMANASRDKIDQCRDKIQKINTASKPMVGVALVKALKTKPDLIIVIPMRAALDDGFQPMVQKNRGDSKIKIHWLSLAQPELGDVLKKVANETKGAYRDVSLNELNNAVK